jgi:hypothetical protein
MDSSEIRRRAIAAVAKLAIFAGVAGCGGKVVIDSTEMPPNDPPEGTVDPPVDETPDLACFGPTADQILCCTDALKTAFSDDHLYVDPSTATENEKACCELAVTTADTWMGPDVLPFAETYFSCCGTGLVSNAWEDHPACSPWGPPMPPAMPNSVGVFEKNEVLA